MPGTKRKAEPLSDDIKESVEKKSKESKEFQEGLDMAKEHVFSQFKMLAPQLPTLKMGAKYFDLIVKVINQGSTVEFDKEIKESLTDFIAQYGHKISPEAAALYVKYLQEDMDKAAKSDQPGILVKLYTTFQKELQIKCGLIELICKNEDTNELYQQFGINLQEQYTLSIEVKKIFGIDGQKAFFAYNNFAMGRTDIAHLSSPDLMVQKISNDVEKFVADEKVKLLGEEMDLLGEASVSEEQSSKLKGSWQKLDSVTEDLSKMTQPYSKASSGSESCATLDVRAQSPKSLLMGFESSEASPQSVREQFHPKRKADQIKRKQLI